MIDHSNYNVYVENEHFMFVEHPKDEKHYAIKFLKGDYEGVIYSYTVINGVTEDEERLNAILSFEYEVFQDLGIILNKEHFIQTIGDVLVSLITNINKSENPSEQMVLDENNRDSNITKSPSERKVCPEGNPVPEG